MTFVTNPGRKLADKLLPHIGMTHKILETCSLLARHAKTYSRYQEDWCCNEYICTDDKAREARETAELRLMERIDSLVRDLPETDDGPWVLRFDGDPRGHTVRIVHPDGREIGLD